MKQLFFRLSTVLLVILAFSFQSKGADKYEWKYNLEKGKTYKQNTVMDMTMKMDAMGQKIVMGTKTETNINYSVVEQNTDGYSIQMTYQKIKVSTNLPTAMTIDSDSPENSSDPELAGAFKSMIGIPVDIQLTQMGKVISINGVDKLVEKMNSISNEQMKQMFSALFTEKTIKAALEQVSNYFPGKPVSIGESWNVNSTVNTGSFDVISKMTLTLKEVKDNIATLDCKSVLSTPEGGAAFNVQGMDANVTMNGEQSGNIKMNMKTGWVVGAEFTQNSTNNIEVMGQTMPQEIEVKSTITAE